MPTVKELADKIASLGNTRKMTRTMKLVAASKLRRAQSAQENARDYAGGLSALLGGLAASGTASEHPLMQARETVKKTLIVVILSDRGLCGGFNNNLIRSFDSWTSANAADLGEVEMSFCGRRGYSHYRHRAKVRKNYSDISSKPTFKDAREIANELMQDFEEGTYDQVYLVYNEFVSVLNQLPSVRKLLPIEDGGAEDRKAAEYLFEPDGEVLLDLLLPNAVRFSFYNALLESSAGEHAARMTAMDSATNNANDLIDRYTLERNRARQAAITKELIEIVTGAEAL